MELQTSSQLQTITEKNIKLFDDKEFNRELLKYAIPIALQQLMISMVSVADTVMLGRVDQNCMSAVSLAAQVQFIQNSLVSSVVSAIAILASQYLGKKDMKSVDEVFCIGLKINAAISFIVFLLCLFTPETLMSIYTNEPLLIETGSRYLRITGWSYLISGISQCYICLIKISNKAKYSAIITGTTVIINVILNAILIFGLFGAPALNERGAAIATLISRIIELIWCVAVMYAPDALRPSLKGLFAHNKLLLKDFMTQLLPLIVAFVMWSVGFSSSSAFMGRLGLDAAAANSLGSSIREMTSFFCSGLAQGAVVVIGRELGKGDLVKGKTYGIKVYKWSILSSAIIFLLMLTLTPLTVSFANMTDQARQYLLGMMLVMSVYMIGRTFNTIVINGIFEAGGDTKFDPISLFICMWCIAIPLAALGAFVLNWSPVVVCAMTCLDEVGKIPIVIHHYKKYKWVKDLTR